MFLTTKGRYAVMAMLELAKAYGTTMRLVDIADNQNVDQAYLEQLFSKLKAAGLVKAFKGPGGGYIIARDPNLITISEVIAAVEENLQMTRCKKEDLIGCMRDGTQCQAHQLWISLEHVIMNFMDNITVQDVISGNLQKFISHA